MSDEREDEQQDVELDRMEISRVLGPDGQYMVKAYFSDGLSYYDALAMLEMTKDTARVVLFSFGNGGD